MNWLDIVVLVLWALVIAWGVWLGLLRILIPLAAAFLALAVASRGAHAIAGLFSPFTNDDNVQNVLAFVLVFLGIFIVGALIGLTVRKAIKFIPLFGLADRLVAPADLMSEATGLAREIAANPAPHLRWVKELLTENGAESDIALVQQREMAALAKAYASEEHKEAVDAFLEKRPPDFRRASGS